MRKYFTLIILLLGLYINAQSNIFLGKDFWKTNPTIEQVKQKIKEGNNPTEFNKWSFDAVCYAIISHAPTETIKYLITLKGNEIDKNTHDGRNYLLWAGYGGDYELVKYLVDKGSDIHWVDDFGYDLVTFTAVGGNTNPQLYDLYKSLGFKLSNHKKNGANALLIASQGAKSINDLQYFVKNGMPLQSVDNKGNNVFLYVASKGNVSLLKELKKANIDYNVVNNNGENALLKSAQGARRHSNKLETFKYLIDLGLNAQQVNNKGENVLHYLAKSNPNWDIFEFLMKQGVDINSVDQKGNTPFMNAVNYNNTNAQNIFKLNKKFNTQNKKGYSVLSYAVANLNVDMVNKLLDKKVNTDIINHENESLINILFANYNEKKKDNFNKILDILKSKGVKPTINAKSGNNLYHYIVEKNVPSLLPIANDLGIDIDKTNKEGLTPLHVSAMKAKDLIMLKALVDLGANIRIHTEFGENAEVMALENELLNVSSEELKFLH